MFGKTFVRLNRFVRSFSVFLLFFARARNEYGVWKFPYFYIQKDFLTCIPL